MAFKKGLSSEKIKKTDEKKGTYYKAPGDRVSYIKKGVIKMYVPRDGKNRLRIVQPLEIEELDFWAMDMHFHRGIGDDGDDLFGDYLCNARMKNILKGIYPDDPEIAAMEGKCFECNQQTGDLWDTNPELAKSYHPDERRWILVNDLLSDDKEEVMLWSAPKSLVEEITSKSTNEETQVYIDVSDPEDGVPVSFERSGKGKLTKYTNVQLFSSPLPMEDGGPVDKGRIEFKDAIVFPSYDLVKAACLNKTIDEVAGIVDDIPESVEEKPVEKEEKAGPPEDCYQKEFDKYQDCDDCEYRDPCANPPKEEKPEKPKKPERKPRKEADDKDSKKDAIRKKIEEAQKKQKG